MIARKIIPFLFLQMLWFQGYSQTLSNRHTKLLSLKGDTAQLDTLSIVPGSISITTKNGTALDTSFYKINYADGLLIFNRKKLSKNNIVIDSIRSSYKTFPFLFSSEVKHKDINRIKPDLFGNINPFSYNAESPENDIFKMDGLDKSGSISRGISFGNNQDMVVNSNLNLQLSGHLSSDVDILLAATDSNIPIQPEGNTQQLQEFDKVFIQISNPNSKLIAGDFQLQRPSSYFMNFHKKAQGISFSTAIKTNTNTPNQKDQGLYKTSLSAAVSRGKFARNPILGIEGNQGPYRLRGAENEPFIIVLSGTERVYINGKLLDRGQENDYVIDYNTAEITFTAKQLITKDKRIVVEFQYSDKNYARSLLHFGNDFEQNKLKLHLHVFSEQDSKNQPLQQALTPQQKAIMAAVGDTLSLAVSPSFDSVAFSNNEVLYQKIDTTIGTHTYTIFKYNADSANYRVTFSNVGTGNGNYDQITSNANGKVFEWVIPDTLTNKPNGSYEPVILLITPKQKQMLTAGIDYAFSANTKLSVEAAMSNNDLNTFSPANSSDDLGVGLKMNFDNAKQLYSDKQIDTSKRIVLHTNVNYEYVQKTFSPIQRYRNVEFERDWNRLAPTVSNDQNGYFLNDQHIAGAGVSLSKKGTGEIGYKINTFFEGSSYNANKHILNMDLKQKGAAINYAGSLLNSESTNNTNFYRHKTDLSQKIKAIVVGVKDEFERNKFTFPKQDSLLAQSYQFWEWQGYIQNADTTKNKYGINYKQRTDYGTKNTLGLTSLNKATFGETYGGFLELIQNPNSQFKFTLNYRTLKIIDSTILLIQQRPENTLISRVEYNFTLWRGLLNSNSFYEVGSGLEVKKEFSFIEVQPGQGVYTWNDYNDNDVKELNEFEVAVLSGTGTYIKVYTPTLDYIKVFTNQFSEMLMLKPAALWANKKGVRKFISRFANQSAYRVDRKSTDSYLPRAYNPFLMESQPTNVTLNSSFRNTVFINQLSPVFGLDLTYQDIKNIALLTSGIDTRQNNYKEAHLRWNMSQHFFWNIAYKDGTKKYNSQFFETRNYSIHYYEAEPKFNYQPNTTFRATISFKYTDKKNVFVYSNVIDSIYIGGEKSTLQDYGVELKYNVLQKGSLNLKANFIQITFKDKNNADINQNTSLAFEMLDALLRGKNYTWGLTYQRNLSNNMQLSLTYDGRQSGKGKMIHTGGAQIRAYF